MCFITTVDKIVSCFQNQSSSTNIAIDAFPLWRTILLLSMLSQFTYFSPPQEANTCVNCALIPTYLHIALVILLYVDNIHKIYML